MNPLQQFVKTTSITVSRMLLQYNFLLLSSVDNGAAVSHASY